MGAVIFCMLTNESKNVGDFDLLSLNTYLSLIVDIKLEKHIEVKD